MISWWKPFKRKLFDHYENVPIHKLVWPSSNFPGGKENLWWKKRSSSAVIMNREILWLDFRLKPILLQIHLNFTNIKEAASKKIYEKHSCCFELWALTSALNEKWQRLQKGSFMEILSSDFCIWLEFWMYTNVNLDFNFNWAKFLQRPKEQWSGSTIHCIATM